MTRYLIDVDAADRPHGLEWLKRPRSGLQLQHGRYPAGSDKRLQRPMRGTGGRLAGFCKTLRRAAHVQETKMPAKSGAQQKAAGAALAAKRGEIKTSELKGASRSMEKSMSETQLDELASTKRKGKPEHVAKS